jgi:DNA-binding XRE family transcriptional regulator
MNAHQPQDPPDAIDEIVAVSAREDPTFPGLFDAEVRRQDLLLRLGELRRTSGLTQTQVAAAMGTSQSAVAKLEVARTDPRLSTAARFALALGYRLEFALVPLSDDSAVGTQRSA